VWSLLVRIVRHFVKFPIPEGLVRLIDNPLRHRFVQPPAETPARHNIMPGMAVLEVGPGTGTYTIATARHVGPGGRVVAIDIEPRVVERLRQRIAREGVTNVETQVADVFDLPFEDASFDAAFMITVIGEIPEPERALRELHRVLKPGGTIAFSELLPDPDYPLPRTVMKWATGAGFAFRQMVGGVFYYTLIFEKGAA
jgi:ubiquinone/menaquinone biosynthesis C-methylase UbiE